MKRYRLYGQSGQRDQFIDFLKGTAIIGVVWLHCMPLQDKMLAPLWCGMSVTMFLLIQVFHAYRKKANISTFPNMRKLFSRILVPMLVFTSILAFIQWHFGVVRHAGNFYKTITDGGYGPGSYYPWLYMQFAFILPLVGVLYRKVDPKLVGGG